MDINISIIICCNLYYPPKRVIVFIFILCNVIRNIISSSFIIAII